MVLHMVTVLLEYLTDYSIREFLCACVCLCYPLGLPLSYMIVFMVFMYNMQAAHRGQLGQFA